MKVQNFLSRIAFLLLLSDALTAQTWQWSRQDEVLNPSGLDISNFGAQFQTLDWNKNGLWDFVINDSTRPRLFLGFEAAAEMRWEASPTLFPSIDIDPFFQYYPQAFQFVGFDFDGDFDLAADGNQFWWNLGTNLSPVWMKDDSVLAGIEHLYNFSFVDYDGDGDWDMTADYGYINTTFYWNTTGGRHPLWSADTTAVSAPFSDPLFKVNYYDVDRDGDLDLFGAQPIPVDPGACFVIQLYRNDGTVLEPEWRLQPLDEYYRAIWCGLFGSPDYQIIDFDKDNDVDFLSREFLRRFAFYENTGGIDSLIFDLEHPRLWGKISVERNAIPFVFDHQADGELDLIVSEDFLYDFVFTFYHEGRLASFASKRGQFDLNNPEHGWFKNPHPLSLYNFANHFHIDFSDFDRDHDSDYLFSYYKINAADSIVGSRVLYFHNQGSEATPEWIPDSSLFADFDLKPRHFWAPQLMDIDGDGDDDLFIKRERNFVFYENVSSGLPLQWREQPTFTAGLSETSYYLATFADLTRDGRFDLVFGREDGKLAFYENIGTTPAPAWRSLPEVFAEIDVGDYAAPAFGDFDRDGWIDLFVGNSNGELFFYRNESTVGVAEHALDAPHSFELYQSYPNPFNPGAKIVFIVPPNLAKQRVVIKIYDLLGRLVAVLFDREVKPGTYEIVWNGKDLLGHDLPSGTYLYRLEAGNMVIAKKMSLVR